MYKTIIFDLDDTLTNDLENTRSAFKVAMDYKNQEFTEEDFLRFHEIDVTTWRDRAAGKIVTPYDDDKVKKTEWMRASRFIKFFGEGNISYEEAVELNNVYMEGMKENVVARPGAFETIRYLFEKGYRIAIATNGPRIPLQTKIEKLGIRKYVNTIFSAEEVGFMKPHKDFYEGLMRKLEISDKSEVLFVGDDLEKDIKGGLENGLDTCWCNYNNDVNNKYRSKYQIRNLEELKNILKGKEKDIDDDAR